VVSKPVGKAEGAAVNPGPVGSWQADTSAPVFDSRSLAENLHRIREPIHVVREGAAGRVGIAFGGQMAARGAGYPLLGTLPALYPEWLGDRSFCEVHGTRFPYASGAMANGIATTELVSAMAKAGLIGFFGAAGLQPDRVSQAIDRLDRELGDRLPWGMNFIHSPNEPELEAQVADMYIRRGVRRVEAAAFMTLTPNIVRYAMTGLSVDAQGRLQRRNHVFAKVSRAEVARRFMQPPPRELLDRLVRDGKLTPEEGQLAARVPVAEDYTVEADSGGHTDNQALVCVLPLMARLRDDLVAQHGFQRPIRIGAAGGLGTPQAVAAAFSMGAAFVVTGSVNQGALQSGLSDHGKQLLAQAQIADVVMAPAADMFELGVKVQVLKRGTMFGVRALRLYELYLTYDGIDAIPRDVKAKLETEILGTTCEAIWEGTRTFFATRDPGQLARADREPKHKLALIFRWYLGLSSKWAIAGDPARRMDYQIWCGPAMGAFNDWARGSFLEPPAARDVVQIARNLLEGAAVVTRAQQLRSYGVPVPASAFSCRPTPLS
jgi:trans-AT polyketide synthase/acyltransferase/oxidoreductase domain-containing protein